MSCVRLGGSRELSFWITVFALLTFSNFSASELAAQTDDLGNGGGHTIQGRLYVSSGRRSGISGLKIRLSNSSSGDISIISDDTGTFTFRGLNAGSYVVTVEGGDIFENVTENVFIDDPGSSSIRTTIRIRSAPRIMTVQIYLRPKASAENNQQLSVINAKWASVPKEALDNYDRGLAIMQQGNDREAEAAFKRSIELFPGFAPSHTELGKIYLKRGLLSDSIACLKLAVGYDANDFETRLNLGVAFLNNRDLDGSEKQLVEAAFLKPHAVTPHYYLGILFIERKNYDIAQKAFEKAKELKRDKDYPLLHRYLGGIYEAKHLGKQAVEELETYLRLKPDAKDADRIRKIIADLKNKQS